MSEAFALQTQPDIEIPTMSIVYLSNKMRYFAMSAFIAYGVHGSEFVNVVSETLTATIGGRVDFVCDGVRREGATFISCDPESCSLVFQVEGREMTVQLRQISSLESVEVCNVCNGSGFYIGDYDYTVEELVDCPNCKNGRIAVGYRSTSGTYGDGSVRHSRVGHTPRSGMKYETCSRCNGTGKIKVKKTKNSGMTKNPCKACNGTPKKTVNLLQNAFMKYLREGFESHVRIEKSQMISAESRKQLVDDPKDIAALSALNLDWYELTDVAGRSLVLVCPTGKEKQFVGENLAFFHLASLGKGNVLVSDNQLVAAFFKAKQCPEMNQSMRDQILANCEAKVKQLRGL